jgi:thioredoxin reductase (NADPH)
VHVCATCDGPFYRGKDVLVVGGGNSAGEESLFLARFADSVTIVTRDDQLKASAVVRTKVESTDGVDVVTGATPVGFEQRDGRFAGLVVECDGEKQTLAADGAFVFIGLTPNTSVVADLVDLDDRGFVVADAGMQTSMPGVFVAGDVRSGSTKQAASAAGEGAAAALAIRRYIEPLASGLAPMHGAEQA